MPKLIDLVRNAEIDIKLYSSRNSSENKFVRPFQKIFTHVKILLSLEKGYGSLLEYTGCLRKLLKKIEKSVSSIESNESISTPDNSASKQIKSLQKKVRKTFAQLAGYLHGFESIEDIKDRSKSHILKSRVALIAAVVLVSLSLATILTGPLSIAFLALILALLTVATMTVFLYHVLKARSTANEYKEAKKSMRAANGKLSGSIVNSREGEEQDLSKTSDVGNTNKHRRDSNISHTSHNSLDFV